MATIKRDGRITEIEVGCKKCRIVGYQSNGRKAIKRNVFKQGYITFELEDGTEVKQYMLIAPWNTYLFYKLIKAIKAEGFNIFNECDAFDENEIIGKEVVRELENEVKDSGEYINVTNIYNVEEGEIIIAYDNKLKEKKYSEMEKNKEMSMEYIRSKANEVIPQQEITSEEDLMNF